MDKTSRQWWHRVKVGERNSQNRERGQSLIIIVLAFIGILALVGLGLDLGRVYVERVRVARAADAAALAGVAELPLESAAHMRALIYLQENGYDYTDSNTYTTLNWANSPREEIDSPGSCTADCIVTGIPCGPPAANCDQDPATGWQTAIWVDTAHSRTLVNAGLNDVDTADRVRVKIRRLVPMTFLQFIGWGSFPVDATAEAENITKLDIALVYDKSGSMRFLTLCHGCWVDDPNYDPRVPGTIWPLRWAEDTGQGKPPDTPDHCSTGNTSYDQHESTDYWVNDYSYRKDNNKDGPYYVVIEAEEYSHSAVDPRDKTVWSTYWVIQRNGKGSIGRDGRGGYISHHPMRNWQPNVPDRNGVSCTEIDIENGNMCRRMWKNSPAQSGDVDPKNFPNEITPQLAPRVEYDFTAPCHRGCGDSLTYHFWIRGQGGNSGGTQYIFWNLDGEIDVKEQDGFKKGPWKDGADDGAWSWKELGSRSLAEGSDHTLNLWAGGAGFDVDRIIVTTSNKTPPGDIQKAPANNARTRDACDYCDPRFAGWYPPDEDGDGNPDLDKLRLPGAPPMWMPFCRYSWDANARPDLRQDELYKGLQPMYDAVQAAKQFITTINPRVGQVGYVSYDGGIGTRSELQCLRQDGPEDLDDPDCDASCPIGVYPLGKGCDPDCGCYRGVISNTVLHELDSTDPDKGTNIAAGIKAGMEILETGNCTGGAPKECGRRDSAKIMIVMTDGLTKENPCGGDIQTDLVPEIPGHPWNKPRHCAATKAQEAGAKGIIIYTITLGDGADQQLMKVIATLGNGKHLHADSSEQLVEEFEELFQQIFVRLTS